MKKLLILLLIMSSALSMNISAQNGCNKLCKALETHAQAVRSATSTRALKSAIRNGQKTIDKLRPQAQKEVEAMKTKYPLVAEQDQKQLDTAIADFSELCELKTQILSGKETPCDAYLAQIVKAMAHEKEMAATTRLTKHDHVMELNFVQDDLRPYAEAFNTWIGKLDRLDPDYAELCKAKIEKATDDMMHAWESIPIKPDDPRHPQR